MATSTGDATTAGGRRVARRKVYRATNGWLSRLLRALGLIW